MAEDADFMKPMEDGWWHLSLQDIRSSNAGEDSAYHASLPVVLDLREWARQNQSKRKTTEDALATDNTNSNRSAPSNSNEDASKTSSNSGTKEAARDTTLHDYTTATTRVLEKVDTAGTNLFRSLPSTAPMVSMDFTLFNRPQPKTDAPGETGSDANSSQSSALPGSPSYEVPTSPLDVVHSSLTTSRVLSDPNPYQNFMTPVLPDTTLPTDSSGKPSDAASTQARAQSSKTPPTTGPDTKPSLPGLTVSNTVMRAGYLPGSQPGNTYQPMTPYQPVFPRNSGPNANGFYEPKSISDLQMGR